MERCLAADEVTAWTASPASDGEDGTPPERMGDVWEHVIEDEVSTAVVRLRSGDPVPSRPLPPVLSWSWSTGDEPCAVWSPMSPARSTS